MFLSNNLILLFQKLLDKFNTLSYYENSKKKENFNKYSPLGKAFEKQIKQLKIEEKKQVEASEVLKPNTQKLTIKDAISENKLTEEAKMNLIKLKK